MEDFVDAVAKLPLEFEPGTAYQYGLNQALLGCVVESITGQSFYEYLKERLFDPLGMKSTKFYVTDEERSNLFQPVFVNSGHLKGFTSNLSWVTFNEDNHAYFGDIGLVSTMSDYTKFCRMLLNGGSFEGREILSPKSIEIMTGKHSEGFPIEERAEPALVGFYRGLSLFVLEDPEADGMGASKGIYGWQGVANTHFWIDPEMNLFGLFMTRARDFSWDVGKRFRESVYSSVR
ncbi:MAG: serine hydrolase [Verrucomicrobia bacterium]|nr:serine hydrolase [Verrucomicrobiota bacterium]MDA1065232.1 serine hydrolase [Verrucomicrobiota bacterium]